MLSPKGFIGVIGGQMGLNTLGPEVQHMVVSQNKGTPI